ncbi:MAG: hypothetical protein M3Z17_07175 [Gemmatimonadota bacterium]|nr:hypothetical protein [Gemmatimonadota bacterium]
MAEQASEPGGVNGVFHDKVSQRNQSLGELFGIGIEVPVASHRTPLTYEYHKIDILRVQNGPVAFKPLSIGSKF